MSSSAKSSRMVSSNSACEVYKPNFDQEEEFKRLTRSLDGFVSSKRIINRPLYIFAKYLLRLAALACPICK